MTIIGCVLRVRPFVTLAGALLTIAALCMAGSSCSSEGSDSAPSTLPSGSAATGTITVFAAASLTSAYIEIGDAFTAENPETTVTFNFASSSDLVNQIIEGAPADVFASADQTNMSKLTTAGGNAESPTIFATNSLQIIVEAGNPKKISGVADLTGDDLIYITCAPEVPIGRYAAEVLMSAGVTVTPSSFEENVKSIVTKVSLGEADAGIVYTTDVIAAGDQATGVEIPADINVTATYPIVVTAEAPNANGALTFVDFVRGEQAQRILATYGFAAP